MAESCDLELGMQVFRKCEACHTLAADGQELQGPSLRGVMGRQSGTLASFKFSPAMRNSGIVWDGESLDRYLLDPMRAIPGSRMPFLGLRDDAEREAVVCYLAETAGE